MSTGPTETKQIVHSNNSAFRTLAIVALLALSVGGALLLLGGEKVGKGSTGVQGAVGRESGEGEKKATPSAFVQATATAVLVGAAPEVTEAAVGEPEVQSTDTPAVQAPAAPSPFSEGTEVPIAEAVEAQGGFLEALGLAAPTNIPIVPQTERTGGPVTVPHNHEGPRWVTLQVGHLRSASFPEELAHLRSSTGASTAGLREVDLNERVAQRTAHFLIERGYKVEILDAVVPVNYTTDFFLSIHADGNESSVPRGFKAVTPWNAVPSTEKFVEIWYEEYGKATGLPTDPRSSDGMANYYAFNPISYRHAVSPIVPAVLIEMGFVTNPLDRRIMTEETDKLAWGITNSIDRWFREGNGGPIPTPYPSFTPTSTPTPTATHTPTETPTSTATATVTHTPTLTVTPIPTEEWEGATATAAVTIPSPTRPPTQTPPASATPTRPRFTPTPVPSPTPLQGIVTADGRWLPPLAPHARHLPQPGSSGPPVRLDTSFEDFVLTADGRERVRTWEQFYYPNIGRSIWKRGPDRPLRH